MQDDLRRGAARRRFADGELVQQRGDTSNGFWLIEQGRVRLGQFSADGTFSAVSVMGPGDSFGELALLSGRRRVVDGCAVGDTRLAWIRGADFETALAAHPSAMRALLAAMSAELQEMIALVALLQRGTATARIAHMLAGLTPIESSATVIRTTQQDLADLVGATRMTVTSVLAKLEQQGLIRRGYGSIDVLDPAGLRALAASG